MKDDVMYWSELAELTHATQVEKFNWCGCEGLADFPYPAEYPYDDCPRPPMCGDCLTPLADCGCLR